ncbi:MAG: hypothetical protein HXX20_02095 [Chloroflexi bacterium]|nr:hypothetical protein [Chloroflexota bacterium]
MAKKARAGRCAYPKLQAVVPTRQPKPEPMSFQRILETTKKGTAARRDAALEFIARTLRYNEQAAYDFACYFDLAGEIEWEKAKKRNWPQSMGRKEDERERESSGKETA